MVKICALEGCDNEFEANRSKKYCSEICLRIAMRRINTEYQRIKRSGEWVKRSDLPWCACGCGRRVKESNDRFATLNCKLKSAWDRNKEIRSCLKYEDCLTKAALRNLQAVPCVLCNEPIFG